MKIAMLIAFQDFRDEEYFIPESIFTGQGFEVETFSSETGKALGSYGGTVDVKLSVDDLKIDKFDALVLVGGSGALEDLDNEKSYKIIREAALKNKVVGAICISPVILAKSGVLKGKKATVWSSNMDKSAVRVLKEEGADYVEKDVVSDDKIITADGPQSARKFAETIVSLLKK